MAISRKLSTEEWEAAKEVVGTSPNYDGALEYLRALQSEAGLDTIGQVASMIGQIEADKGSLDAYLAAGRKLGMSDGEIMTARQAQVRVTGLAAFQQIIRAAQASVTANVAQPAPAHKAAPVTTKPTRVQRPAPVTSDK